MLVEGMSVILRVPGHRLDGIRGWVVELDDHGCVSVMTPEGSYVAPISVVRPA